MKNITAILTDALELARNKNIPLMPTLLPRSKAEHKKDFRIMVPSLNHSSFQFTEIDLIKVPIYSDEDNNA